MITRHIDFAAAHKDREYWFKQGYAVGILWPSGEDEFYKVYVNPLEKEAQNVGCYGRS